MMPSRAYNLLGKALVWLIEDGIEHVDKNYSGWRIRLDRIVEHKHRDMELGDITDEIHIR